VQVATILISEQYQVLNGLPLTKDDVFQISFNINENMFHGGGSLQQRLSDKPCFMGG
jgi:hypothetical protein